MCEALSKLLHLIPQITMIETAERVNAWDWQLLMYLSVYSRVLFFQTTSERNRPANIQPPKGFKSEGP